jgi:hypothetical protein
MRRILLSLAFLTLACKGGSDTSQDVLLVRVEAPGLTGIARLNVIFTNADASETRNYPSNASSAPIGFPTTLSATMPASRIGNIDVSINGLDAQTKIVAYGQASKNLVSGGEADVTVVLTAVGPNPTGTGGQGGTGGSAGAGGSPVVCTPGLIDNMEQPLGGVLPPCEGRVSGWYTFNDGAPQTVQTPAPGQPFSTYATPGANGSAHSIRTYGRCAPSSATATNLWGAGVGFDLDNPGATATSKIGYTATSRGYGGIKFWARLGETAGANPVVSIHFPDANTDPSGGVCSGSGCYDDYFASFTLTPNWDQHTIYWTQLTHAGWGVPNLPFASNGIMSVQWHFATGTTFDMYIDDVAFVTGSGSGAGGAGGGGGATGITGSGGTSGSLMPGFMVDDSGYVTAGPWQGWAWTATETPNLGTTITPTPASQGGAGFTAVKAGSPLCTSGIVAQDPNWGGIAMLGVNIAQEKAVTFDPSITWTPTGTGVKWQVANTGASPLRLVIQGPAGYPTQQWCYPIAGGSGTVKWADFNSKCWGDATTVPYDNTPLDQVLIQVPGLNAAAQPFNFCLQGVAPY